MMRMIRRLSGQLTGGKRAVDDFSRGGAQRVEIRPVQVRAADVEDGERLAIDGDGNLVRSLRERDLGPAREGDPDKPQHAERWSDQYCPAHTDLQPKHG